VLRGAGLMAGYAAYGVIFAAVALCISARARTAASALLVLLSIWAVSVVIVPRVAASIAEQIHPTPDAGEFWAATSRQISARRLKRDSDEFRALERQVVSRALGRDVTMAELSSLPLSREAISLEVAERRGADVHGDAFRELYSAYEGQQSVWRWFSILSPTIALQQLSSTLAGTDIGAHRDFALQAEQQRNAVIRSLNEDMMLRGAGQGYDYLAGRELWARIPDFHYRPPGARVAVRAAFRDGVILLAWSVVAFGLSWRAALRQS
jgi:ABC-2 type transport system permease protein